MAYPQLTITGGKTRTGISGKVFPKRGETKRTLSTGIKRLREPEKKVIGNAETPEKVSHKKPRSFMTVSKFQCIEKPLDNLIEVKIAQQQRDTIPPLWQSSLSINNKGHLLALNTWKKWLNYTTQKPPEREYMSHTLWPAITQLITAVYYAESDLSSNTALSCPQILAHWPPLDGSRRADESDETEKLISLTLCKHAMADSSPLTPQQKRFLTCFLFYRMDVLKLKTNLFEFLAHHENDLPSIERCAPFLNVDPCNMTDTEKLRHPDVLPEETWKKLHPSLLTDHPENQRGKETPPKELQGFPTYLWRFALTFANVICTKEDNLIKAKEEFNVGKDDMMNSEYFACSLRFILASDLFTDRHKTIFCELLDKTLQTRDVYFLLGDDNITGWRGWLKSFKPGIDSAPKESDHHLLSGIDTEAEHITVTASQPSDGSLLRRISSMSSSTDSDSTSTDSSDSTSTDSPNSSEAILNNDQ